MAAENSGFGFWVKAFDQSHVGFGSVLRNAGRFGSLLKSTMEAPFRAIAKIQLPLFAGIQNLKALGSLGEAIGKMSRDAFRGPLVQSEFAKRLGITESRAYAAARALQEASLGAMNLDQTMEMANRMMAQGLEASQIGKIFQFASVKSKTANIEFPEIAESIARAFATGRARGIRQFGLGMNLQAGASRAETIASVMGDIDDQIKIMGVSGNEAVFTFDRMKQSIADVADSLLDAVAGTDLLANMAARANETAGMFRDFLNRNAKDFQEVVNSVVNAMATGVKSLAGGLGTLVAGITPKGLLETFARLGFLASRFVLRVREGFLEIKMGLLRLGATFIEEVAIPWAEIMGRPKETFDGLVATHRRLNQSIREAYREHQQIEKTIEDINDEEAKAVVKIWAMKEGAEKVGPVFEGLGAKLRNWGHGFLTPIQEMAKAMGSAAAAGAKAAGDAARKELDSATARVKELKGLLDQLNGNRFGDALEKIDREFAGRRVDLAARFGDRSQQVMRADFEHAKQLLNEANKAGLTEEQRRQIVGRGQDILKGLRTNQDVIRDRQKVREVEEQIGRGDNILDRWRGGAVNEVKQKLKAAEGQRRDVQRQVDQQEAEVRQRQATESLSAMGKAARDVVRNLTGLSGALRGFRFDGLRGGPGHGNAGANMGLQNDLAALGAEIGG